MRDKSRLTRLLGTHEDKYIRGSSRMDAHIVITQEMIDGGTRNDAFYCPIAKALTAAADLCDYLFTVNWDGIDVWLAASPEERTVTPYPEGVAQRITEYDLHGRMEPFEFGIDLRLPTKS